MLPDCLRQFSHNTARPVIADNRRRNRPNLRVDVQGRFLSNLLTSVGNGDITLQNFLDRAEHVMKPLLRLIQAFKSMRANQVHLRK